MFRSMIGGFEGKFYYLSGNSLYSEEGLVHTYNSLPIDLKVDEGSPWVLLQNCSLCFKGVLFAKNVRYFDVRKGQLSYIDRRFKAHVWGDEDIIADGVSVDNDCCTYLVDGDNLIKFDPREEETSQSANSALSYFILPDGSELRLGEDECFYLDGQALKEKYTNVNINSEGWILWSDQYFTGTVSGGIVNKPQGMCYSGGFLGVIDYQGAFSKRKYNGNSFVY